MARIMGHTKEPEFTTCNHGGAAPAISRPWTVGSVATRQVRYSSCAARSPWPGRDHTIFWGSSCQSAILSSTLWWLATLVHRRVQRELRATPDFNLAISVLVASLLLPSPRLNQTAIDHLWLLCRRCCNATLRHPQCWPQPWPCSAPGLCRRCLCNGTASPMFRAHSGRPFPSTGWSRSRSRGASQLLSKRPMTDTVQCSSARSPQDATSLLVGCVHDAVTLVQRGSLTRLT
jgi:hypothetical protein